MHYPISVMAILILVGAAQADDSGKSWQIQGQVVDEQGMPIDDFDAATFWSSNGKQWDEAGKQLPFPVLIDGEGKTSSIYGIHSWPTVLLIDPEGHLVKGGGETTLAEKLKAKNP